MTAPTRWRARRAGDEIYSLGEGPVWDAPRSRLLWVDIDTGTVHEGRLVRRTAADASGLTRRQTRRGQVRSR